MLALMCGILTCTCFLSGQSDLSGGVEGTHLVQLQTSDHRSSPVYTHIQVVLSLVLSDLLQNGQILLLDAVVFRLLPVHGFLFFHLIVVQIFDILQVLGEFYDFMAPETSTPPSLARNHPFQKGGSLYLSHLLLLLFFRRDLFGSMLRTHTHTNKRIKGQISAHWFTFFNRKCKRTGLGKLSQFIKTT